MKTKILLPACLFVFTSTLYAHSSDTRLSAVPHVTLADSVGIEKKDGKRFILHRVDQGQTLYAIARRYGRPVSDIKAANPGMGESVRYDQVVRIPIPEESISRKEAKAMDKAIRKAEKAKEKETTAPQKSGPVASTAVQPTARQSNNEARKTDDPARAGIHIVEPRQTLYSLAVQYGVSQSDLRKWNNLSANNVLIGQALIVSEKAYLDRLPNTPAPAKSVETPVSRPTPNRPAETRPTTSRPEPKPEKTPTKKPDESPATDSRPSAATVTKPAETAEPVESPRPGNDAPMPTYGRRIVVSGVAEMIDGTDESGKYLALHRTAPIGTLVQVRNAFNNQSLWVKVIGRLPNTGVNDKILIKLSAQAFAKLSPDDRRFRAEVSYIVK